MPPVAKRRGEAVVHIIVGGPKIDLDSKRKLAAGITDIASEVYGIAKEHIVVVIEETNPENVSVVSTVAKNLRHS